MAQTYARSMRLSGGRARPPFAWWVDLVLILAILSITYGVVALATRWSAPLTPTVQIDLSISALPGYAGLSTLRMTIAYLLAAGFSLAYARFATASPAAERIMLPLLDVLQSIPILSFMPGVVLGLVALFPSRNLGVELAAIVLIFTSQAWNLAFAFHQSLRTIPSDLRETAAIYRMNIWDRFTRLELPFGMLDLPGGLSLAAVALMLLGTQWYILFNVIAGAMAIPSDLREAAAIYKLHGWKRWRHLILPAIFPSLITGMITATGGAWNASIVAEYVTFGGKTLSTVGLGSSIAGAADAGNFPLLLAGTLTMAGLVVAINRLGWRRLSTLAEQRFRLE